MTDRRDRDGDPSPRAGDAAGVVVAHFGVEVAVRGQGGAITRAPVRRGSTLVVGDRVSLESGFPRRLERRGVLRRRDRRGRVRAVAAHLDRVGVVLASRPRTPDAFVDRAVVGARAAGTPPFLVVNKADRGGADALADAVRATWRGVEPVLVVSANRGTGLDAIASLLAAAGRAVFVGVSGVGKSSLVNALVEGAGLSVGPIHPGTGQGRHVTTAATLHRLTGGGELIDTPGFRDFGPVDVAPEELAAHFPGFEQALARGCRYRDCRHRDEPDCAVREAVERGEIPPARHAAYLALLDEIDAAARAARGY